jgi:transcription elongation factor GreA
MQELVKISKTGFEKLNAELAELEKQRVKVAKDVADAREQGDLTENGAYIYGRQQLGFIDGRLGELRGKINFSQVIDCTKVTCDKAQFGTCVKILDIDKQQHITYQLLGPHDADIDQGSISILSPVGKAIHGLSVGDKGTADIPRGNFNFQVVEISKSQIE